MAISFVGAGSGTVGTSAVVYNFSSLLDAAGATPTILQGDYVLVSWNYRATSAFSPALPTGFIGVYANIFANATTNDENLRSIHKFMSVTPDTSVTIPAAATPAGGTFTVHVLRGVDPVTPLDVAVVTASGVNAAAHPDAPSATPVTAGAWIYVVGGVSGSAISGAVTNGGDLSATANHFQSGTQTASALGAGLKTNWAAGAFDPAAFAGGQSTSSSGWAAATVVIRPDAGPVVVTGNGITTGSPVIGSPALTQSHVLAGVTLATGSPVIGSPALTQLHVLAGTNLVTSSPAIGSPVITQVHVLSSPTLSTGSPVLGAPALTQLHNLSATSLVTASPSIGSPGLTQKHVFSAVNLATGSPVLGTPTVTIAGAIVAVNIATASPVIGSPALTQKHIVAANDNVTGSPVIGSPALTVRHILTANSLALGVPVIGLPVLAQRHVVAAIGITTGQPSIGLPTLQGVDERVSVAIY